MAARRTSSARRSPRMTDDAPWAAYLFMRHNPKGPIRERWRHAHGCGRWFHVLRDTVSDDILAVYRIGDPPPPVPERTADRGAQMTQRFRTSAAAVSTARAPSASPSTARATRAIPATRWPRPFSPTASTCSAAASSTTARAASSPPVPRSPTPSSESTRAAAGPIPTSVPPRSSCSTDWPPRARTAGPRSASMSPPSTTAWPRSSRPASTTRPSSSRPPGGRRSTSRASGPRPASVRARRQPDPDRYLHRHAHCDVLVVGAGPAGLMAALAAGRSGARVILCDEQAEPGGSLLAESGERLRIAGEAPDAWLAAMLAELAAMPEAAAAAAHHLLRLLQPQLSGPPRAGDGPSGSTAARPAAPAALAGARKARRPRHRRHRAAAGLSLQRPARASCWPRPPGPTPIAGACWSAARSLSSPTTTAPMPPPSISPPPAPTSPPSSTCATRRRERCPPWPSRRASRSSAAVPSSAPRGAIV